MKKIVLTANDNLGLNGNMAMHFGHCPYYVVAHVHEDNRVEKAEVQDNPYLNGHQPGQIPQFIKSLGADVVIAGGMGANAIDWFKKLDIEVVTGVQKSVGATLDAYLAGNMAGASGCNHEH
jgi:predicted Fe-Mo cluster-binding NifX family protein